MAKLMGGEPSLTKQIGGELNEKTPPWEQLQGQTREYAEEAAKLGEYEPRKGSKESWSKLSASFSRQAAALDKAVQNKDKDAGLEAHKEITQSCRACHQEHRIMRGPGGMPGGFGPGMFFGGRVLAQLDSDKDKKLSRGEMAAGVKQFFKDADKDNKGALDKQALTEGVKRLLPAAPPMPGGGPEARPGGPGRPGLPGKMEEEVANNIFKRADSNKDGKVTLEELLAAAEALFNEVDKDKKEKLDEREVGAGINKLFPALPAPPGGRGMPGMPGVPGGPGLPPPAPPG